MVLIRSAAEGARARVKVSCIGRSRARRGRSCHVPVNSLTTLTTRIPRGRRGLVDNWRRASKLLLSQYIIQTRVGTSRHADSPRLIGLIVREACLGARANRVSHNEEEQLNGRIGRQETPKFQPECFLREPRR